MNDASLKESLQNAISTKQMYKEYNWFSNTFPKTVQGAYDEFFTPNFRLELIGLSKNINCLLSTESCFVTKVRIDYEYDMYFRLTDSAVEIILNKVLGPAKHRFNINKISEIEAKVITAFNDFAFNQIKQHLNPPPANELKRVNFDLIHMTYIIQDVDDFNKKTGKVIVTLPAALLNPQAVVSKGEKFAETDFPNQHTVVSLDVGKTKFSVYDLKHLEEGDVVVFEDSVLENMDLRVSGEVLPVNLNPNMDLLITDEQEEGNNMANPEKSIWDSIEVEMVASFDSVKITLGELKDIEDGLVVDLASLYDNNVTLKVEDKSIASGSLVIVNDRYGVKVNKVIAGAEDMPIPKRKPAQAAETGIEEQNADSGESVNPEGEEEYTEGEFPEGEYAENGEGAAGGEEEEFDYSDFDLDDDNI
jgi:flagellar motor switch/type III secretory pathway protein FliN